MELVPRTDDQRINVRIENYTGEKPIEIIYREDKAKEVLKPIPARLPEAFSIDGIISAPTEWLGKNFHLIDEDNSRVEVDREGGEIRMILNERNVMDAIVNFNELGKIIANRSTVTGRIQLTDAFKKLHINTDEFWSTKKLAKFLRLNRSIFAKKDEGMLLVSQLKNVQAKITGDYEKKTELHGHISKTEFMTQQVEHNIMPRFAVNIAIFKGAPKETYEIEIDADIIDGQIQVQLLSPAINDEVESERDKLIDKELAEIAKICPNMPIIEK